MEEVRLNKYLSGLGICSRREADRMAAEGRILVNGGKAVPGMAVSDADDITVDGRTVNAEDKAAPVVLAYNKAVGVVCSSSGSDNGISIDDITDYGTRVYPVGRLDRDSHGLILLTNRGELVNRLNKSGGAHEKEYIVRCSKPVTDGFLDRMARGVEINVPERQRTGESARTYRRVKTLPCRTQRQDEFTFAITLTQGLNRQIRRMCEELGNNVTDLKRTRIMNVRLGRLKEGTYRRVKGEELKELERLLFQRK